MILTEDFWLTLRAFWSCSFSRQLSTFMTTIILLPFPPPTSGRHINIVNLSIECDHYKNNVEPCGKILQLVLIKTRVVIRPNQPECPRRVTTMEWNYSFLLYLWIQFPCLALQLRLQNSWSRKCLISPQNSRDLSSYFIHLSVAASNLDGLSDMAGYLVVGLNQTYHNRLNCNDLM